MSAVPFTLSQARLWHAEAYAEMARMAAAEMEGPGQTRWFAELDECHGQLRTALRSLREEGRTDEALGMCVAMHRFWLTRGHREAGLRETAETLAGPADGEDAPMRSRAHHLAGGLAARIGDRHLAEGHYRRAKEYAEACGNERLALQALGGLARIATEGGDSEGGIALMRQRVERCRLLGDEDGVANAQDVLAITLWERSECTEAGRLWRKSLRTWRKRGHRQMLASTLNCLGLVAWQTGDTPKAKRLWAQTLRHYRELNDRGGLACCLDNIGGAALDGGDCPAASSAYRESLQIRTEIREPAELGVSNSNLGNVALYEGHLAEAERRYRTSLQLHHSIASWRGVAYGLEGFARIAACRGDWPLSARLHGAAAALRERIRVPRPVFPAFETAVMADCLARIRAGLGDDAAERFIRRGAKDSLEVVIRVALDPAGGNSDGSHALI